MNYIENWHYCRDSRISANTGVGGLSRPAGRGIVVGVECYWLC
ncbi:MAG: hypothetical protein WCR05_01415 [Sphaerochaetaceae bacterium]